MRTPAVLYHFTSSRHLAEIKASGSLSKGVMPNRLLSSGKPSFIRGFQWLTIDPEWSTQSWADPMLSGLPYRKNEHRITIEFPNFALANLVSWEEFKMKVRPDSAPFLDSFRGHRHWWIYRGVIPCMWFAHEAQNPTPIFLPQLDQASQ